MATQRDEFEAGFAGRYAAMPEANWRLTVRHLVVAIRTDLELHGDLYERWLSWGDEAAKAEAEMLLNWVEWRARHLWLATAEQGVGYPLGYKPFEFDLPDAWLDGLYRAADCRRGRPV